MFFRRKTVYITPGPSLPRGDAYFQRGTFWTDLQHRLRSLDITLRALPLRRIPSSAPLILSENILPSSKTFERLRSRDPSRLFLFQMEPPTVLPFQHTPACYDLFGRVYTLRDDLADGQKFRKIVRPHPLVPFPSPPPFEERRLLTFVFRNNASSLPCQLYSERHRLVQYFESRTDADFTFYGRGWDHLGYRNYGGSVDDKLATISRFRYCIAYENTCGVPGYVTEKILDCLAAGTVPVYWGAPNITDYVPADCFIHRPDFPSDEALHDHLLSLTADDHARYVEAGQRFLQSPRARPFHVDTFTRKLATDIAAKLDQ